MLTRRPHGAGDGSHYPPGAAALIYATNYHKIITLKLMHSVYK